MLFGWRNREDSGRRNQSPELLVSPLGVQVHNVQVSEAREIIHSLISDAARTELAGGQSLRLPPAQRKAFRTTA